MITDSNQQNKYTITFRSFTNPKIKKRKNFTSHPGVHISRCRVTEEGECRTGENLEKATQGDMLEVGPEWRPGLIKNIQLLFVVAREHCWSITNL